LNDYSRLIQDSMISKRIVSFLDKILVVNFLKIFTSLIFVCSIVYLWNLGSDYYVWRTDFSIFWLVVILITLITVYGLDKSNLLEYNRSTLLFAIFLYTLILLASYFTLTLSHTLLIVSHFSLISSFIFLWLYCGVRKKLENLKKNDLKSKIFNLVLFILSVLFYKTSSISDPLISTVLFCVFPFYIVPFFIVKDFSLLLSYRSIFFIYLFFISSTIYPYLLLASLVIFFISKFYFLVKFNTKYPTFLNEYDRF